MTRRSPLHRKPHKRHEMVRWLSPSALFTTAIDVVISGVFGRYSDKRELEGALPAPDPTEFAGDDLWIDYIADVGDGWDSTYTMAWLLTRDPEQMGAEGAALRGTERGKVLIFGGDEVYPKAGRQEYEERLLAPYRAAAAHDLPPHERSVFAIPGNHDWYDGLTSWMRIFCRKQRFATWDAPQKRSYFALKLPHTWWLLGIDIAFDYYIDESQLNYFRGLRCPHKVHSSYWCGKRLHAGDKVILCTAKPAWEEAQLSGDFHAVDQEIGRQALYELESEITRAVGDRDGWGCHLRLVLSGDLHHYVRYASEDPELPQRITAGGGGAFFYPTHALAPTVPWPSDEHLGPRTLYDRQTTFPEPKESKRWLWLLPLAPVFANPTFAVMVGAVDVLLWLILKPSFDSVQSPLLDTIGFTKFRALWSPPDARPVFVIPTLLVLLALFVFSDRKTSLGGLVFMALPHWIAQMYALTVAIHVSEIRARAWLPRDGDGDWKFAFLPFAGLLLVFVGGLLGGVVMGVYLTLAQWWFGRHPNEAYAAMHISRYKNFLRIKVEEDRLLVYPVGVRRVSTRWCEDFGAGENRGWSPLEDPIVELIEPPISIPAFPTQPTPMG